MKNRALEIKRMMKAWPEHYVTAIHEAGHLVVSRFFRRQIRATSIHPDASAAGHFIFGLPCDGLNEERENLIILAAGGIAQRKYEGKVYGDDRSDRGEMQKRARTICGWLVEERELAFELLVADRRAGQLVDRFWEQIQIVAGSLLYYHCELFRTPTFSGRMDQLDKTLFHQTQETDE